VYWRPGLLSYIACPWQAFLDWFYQARQWVSLPPIPPKSNICGEESHQWRVQVGFSLASNISPGWKELTVTNTLVYHIAEFIMAVKANTRFRVIGFSLRLGSALL